MNFIQLKQKFSQTKLIPMASVANLLTNSTNRFYRPQTTLYFDCQSNFTPLIQPFLKSQSIKSKASTLFESQLLQNIPQTYQKLRNQFHSASKLLNQANHQKQFMAMILEKVFLIESGKADKLKKRFRRKKNQIQGKHLCLKCCKIYSSSTSLSRHMKLKHSYTMLEPPLRNYQIPPEPNSVIDSTDPLNFNEIEINSKNICQTKQTELNSKEQQLQEFGSFSDSCSEDSLSQQSSLMKEC